MKLNRPLYLLFAVISPFCIGVAVTQIPGCIGGNPAVTADQTKLKNDIATSQPATVIAADNSQLATDVAAIKTAQLQQGAQIATMAASFAPSPWDAAIQWIIPGLLAAGIAVVGHQSTASVVQAGVSASANAALTANASSANHAANISQLANAATAMASALATSVPGDVHAQAIAALAASTPPATASGVIPITTGTVTVNGATVPPKSA